MIILGRPHLMLADSRGDDRLIQSLSIASDLPQSFNGVLGHDGVVALAVAKRLLFSPFLDSANPLGVRIAYLRPPPLPLGERAGVRGC